MNTCGKGPVTLQVSNGSPKFTAFCIDNILHQNQSTTPGGVSSSYGVQRHEAQLKPSSTTNSPVGLGLFRTDVASTGGCKRSTVDVRRASVCTSEDFKTGMMTSQRCHVQPLHATQVKSCSPPRSARTPPGARYRMHAYLTGSALTGGGGGSVPPSAFASSSQSAIVQRHLANIRPLFQHLAPNMDHPYLMQSAEGNYEGKFMWKGK